MLGSLFGLVGAAYKQKMDQDNAQKATLFQNEQTLRMYREGPKAQMEGFANAGLNPMLAYSRMEFGSSANTAAFPSDMGQALVAGYQADAANTSATASASQAATASRLADETVDKIKAETANLKTENGKIIATIDMLRHQAQLLFKQGLNQTDIGNQIRATIDKLRAEIPNINAQQLFTESNTLLNADQQALLHAKTKLLQLDIKAAENFDNLARNLGQLKPLVEILRLILRK